MDLAAYAAELTPKTKKALANYENTKRHMRFVRENRQALALISLAMEEDDLCYAAQLWNELDQMTRRAIYQCAPLKGGYLTTAERKTIKEDKRFAIYWEGL